MPVSIYLINQIFCYIFRPLTDDQPKKKTPIIIDPSRASQQINNYIEDFSNTLLKSTPTTAVPKLLLPKVATFASAPSVSNGSLPNGSTFVAFKPSIQTMKTISSNFPRTEGNTIFVGNKQYHVISRSSANQIRAGNAQNGIVMTSMVQKPEISVKVCIIFHFDCILQGFSTFLDAQLF